MERFWRDVEPFAGKIDHPRFFAFIPSSPTFASVLGDWLASGCNFFQGTWIESAGPSEVELVVLDWIKEGLRLEAEAGGVLTSGGSVANLIGLAVARHQRVRGEMSRATAYTSDQTHSAVARALRILGFPEANLRRLPSDAKWRLNMDALAESVRADRSAGLEPFCVIATAGTTNTGAVDPLRDLADFCEREQLWLHVDGAYGAIARLSPTCEPLLEGLERADSLVLDPHKWLYVGYEAGCLFVRDRAALETTFRMLPDYLQDTGVHEGEVNFGDRGVQLSRAARGIKLWLSLKTHGFAAVIRAIERTIQLAEYAERRILDRSSLEVVAPASLGIVCFRHRCADETGGERLNARNEAIVRTIQRDGRFMISSTLLDGSYVVRLCPLNYRTAPSDIDALLEEVEILGERLSGASGRDA
jgi:glutamate/tyrosine decarboxylase-like PLP-dependent enzyme